MREDSRSCRCAKFSGLFVLVFLTVGVCLAQGIEHSISAQERVRIEVSPQLPFHPERYLVVPPNPDWESGTVSGVAVGPDGTIYEVQRGAKSDPVLVLSREGRILNSWGRGEYVLPHSIRLDFAGNVWTVDAASSKIIEYSASGRKKMTIEVGGQPKNGSLFRGATDIAFAPGGNLFVTDGYGNARVLEYTSSGRKVRAWGRRGAGAGEMNLPHSIQVAGKTVYVADRENGRIEQFDLSGRYRGEIAHLGRVYSIKVAGGAIWATMGPFDQPAGAGGGWVVKLDRRSGKILGHLDVNEATAGHALDLSPSGEPILTLGNGLLWFKADR